MFFIKLINHFNGLVEKNGHKHLMCSAGGRRQTKIIILIKMKKS